MKRSTRSTTSDDGGVASSGKDGVAPVKSPSESSEKKRAKRTKDVKAGSGFDTRWRFKVEPQPPKFPFKDEYFNLNVYLVDQDGVLKPNFEVPISLDLFVEGESVPICNTNLQGSTSIEVDPETPSMIDKSGCARLRVKVCELSMNRNNRKFCFVVKRKAGPRGELPRDVNPVMTRAMLVVNSHIKILNQLPEVWYKDQGGRDKCIDIDLELHGPNGIVTGQEVPVRCVLLYEDYQQVINQDILQPSPTTIMAINKTGRSQIRVRIEDVSKNHQSKNFRIKVEPDTSRSPVHFDKSPDISTPILVRSKLNRRQKMKLAMQSHDTLRGEEAIAVAAIKEQQMKAAAAAASSQQPPVTLAATTPPTEATQPRVEDFSKFTPELATALWCQSSRNAMATLASVMAQFVQSFDRQILPHVKQILDREGGYEHLCNQVQNTAADLQGAGSSSSSSPGSLNGGHGIGGGGITSLLPSESMASHASVPFEMNQQEQAADLGRSMSVASQGMAQIMRGSSLFFRSISGAFPSDAGHGAANSNSQGSNYGFSGPGDLNRELSYFSFTGLDDNFGSNKPGSVLRMHSLAPTQEELDDPDVLRRYRSQGSSNVSYILKSLYKANEEVKGLPAFDRNKRLVGFFFQQGKGFPSPMVSFKNVVNAFPGQADIHGHIRMCESKFEELLEQDSSLVYSVANQQDGYDAAMQFFQPKS